MKSYWPTMTRAVGRVGTEFQSYGRFDLYSNIDDPCEDGTTARSICTTTSGKECERCLVSQFLTMDHVGALMKCTAYASGSTIAAVLSTLRQLPQENPKNCPASPHSGLLFPILGPRRRIQFRPFCQ